MTNTEKRFTEEQRANVLRPTAEQQRDALLAQNKRLRAALENLTALCDNVPIFQLDGGKSSVKAVRLAGKFTAAVKQARDALNEKE